MKLRTILATVFVVGGVLAPAQEFRGAVVDTRTLGVGSSAEISLGSGEVILFAIDGEALRFVRALQFTASRDRRAIPDGSFSLVAYGSVTAPETTGVATLAGRRLEVVPLVGTRQVIVVPVREGEPATTTGAVTTDRADPRTGFVGIQLIPLMKGMSDEMLRRRVAVAVTPLLRRVGAIALALEGEAAAEAAPLLSVTVNGTAIDPEAGAELAPGIYRVVATAGEFVEFSGNVGVELGRTTEVVLEAVRPRATVRLIVPTVADLFLDGEPVEAGTELQLAPGSHTLLVRLGDFAISRRFEFEAHREYEIELDLDLLLNQN